MRVSVDKDDPGYETWRTSRPATYSVLLDGQVVRDAITADDEKGEVVRFARNEQGHFYFAAGGENEVRALARETLQGVVCIVRVNHSPGVPK